MSLSKAFDKYTPPARPVTASTVQASQHTAAVHIDTAGECPMCKKPMKRGLTASRDIPVYWCQSCNVATPAPNTVFAGL
jgi:hypothetical protein